MVWHRVGSSGHERFSFSLLFLLLFLGPFHFIARERFHGSASEPVLFSVNEWKVLPVSVCVVWMCEYVVVKESGVGVCYVFECCVMVMMLMEMEKVACSHLP